MVLSVRIRIQCGMGLFCLIFLASFFLIINVLCDGCSIIIYIKTNKKPQLKLSQLHNQRERDRECVCELPFSLLRSIGCRENPNCKILRPNDVCVYIEYKVLV